MGYCYHNRLGRGLVRALMHLQSMPVPYEWFASVDAAMAWAAAKVANKQ